LWSATSSTLTTVIMVLFGMLLSKMGVMGPSTSKDLSKMVKDIAVPCLLFSRVGGQISIENLIKWLPVPVYAISNTLFGCFIGYIVALIGRAPPPMQRFTMVSVGFTNTNTIPLAFMQTLAYQETSLLRLPGDNGDDINKRGQTFILMYSLTITFLRWTLADRMLEHKPGDGTNPNKRVSMPKEDILNINNPVVLSRREKILNRVKETISFIFELLPIPLWSCIIAVVIGLSPARDLFFTSNTNPNHVPPLFFCTTAITLIGSTVTPMMNVVLGSKLTKGPKEVSNVFLVMLTCWLKLVVIPLLFGIGLIYFVGTHITHWITDPTMLFVLLLESANPPALLLLLMCAANDFMVDEMTALIFYSYIFAVFSLTAFSFLFLLLL